MAYRQLKRFKVKFLWWESDWEEINLEGVSVLVQLAPLLEELCLKLWFFSPALPRSFLDSVEAPHLRTLKLRYATFRDLSELLHFLYKHALTLKTVDFWGLSLIAWLNHDYA